MIWEAIFLIVKQMYAPIRSRREPLSITPHASVGFVVTKTNRRAGGTRYQSFM